MKNIKSVKFVILLVIGLFVQYTYGASDCSSSNTFTIDNRENLLSLEGYVYESGTGSRISGASVKLGSYPADTTNSNGRYIIQGVSAGSYSISASKSGYNSRSTNVTLSGSSYDDQDFYLVKSITSTTKPAITSVQSQYCGEGKHVYIIAGKPFTQTFEVSIDWKTYSPSQVRWYKDNAILDTSSVSGSSASKSIDVGLFSANQMLYVQAVASDGTTSGKYKVNFDILPKPPIFVLFPAAALDLKQTSSNFEYEITGLSNAEILSVDIDEKDGEKIDSDFPIFGGADMGFSADVDFGGVVTSDGRCSLFTADVGGSAKKKVMSKKDVKVPLANISAKPEVLAQIDLVWNKTRNQWLPEGSIYVGCDLDYEGLPKYFAVVWGIPLYAKLSAGLDLDLELDVYGWTEDGPAWIGRIEFEPTVEGTVGAGFASVLAVEGTLGGGFHSGIEFPEYKWVDSYIILKVRGTVYYIIGSSSKEFEYKWPDPDKSKSIGVNDLYRVPTSDWELLDRDYLKYRTKVAKSGTFGTKSKSGSLYEQTIVPAEFPFSMPDLAVLDNGELLSVWVSDDTSRGLINRTSLRFAVNDGTGWSEPLFIESDGTADGNPVLRSVPGGNAVCIFQDASIVLADNQLDEALQYLDIAVSVYNSSTGVWSTPETISDNTCHDRSGTVAVSDSGTMLAMWVSNTANDLWGSTVNTNDFYYAVYDGSSWSSQGLAVSGQGTVLGTALEYDGMVGHYVYCIDGDDNLDTTDDQELYYMTFDGETWTVPAAITSNSIADVSPRLIIDSDVLYLSWMQDGNIMIAEDMDIANAELAITLGDSVQSRDFEFIISPNGQRAIILNDTSEAGNDLYVSYYNPAFDVWSEAIQITNDTMVERFISSAFASDGKLVAVYDKNITEYEDVTATVDGREVIVPNVPKSGQSDLTSLSYEIKADLAISASDISIAPANPALGDDTVIEAVVSNVGEDVVENIQVAFYDGDPADTGVLIGSVQTVSGVLSGGSSAAVSVNWTVPAGLQSHDIYVVVDPDMLQTERSLLNNTAMISVMQPDLAVSSLNAARAGNMQVITARIANEGVLPVESFIADFYAGESMLIESVDVFNLQPGGYQDVSIATTEIPAGLVDISVMLDGTDAICESNEDNNSKTATVQNYLQADFNEDESVGLMDFAIMASDWLSDDLPLEADLAPLGGDDIVDVKDLSEFMKSWLE